MPRIVYTDQRFFTHELSVGLERKLEDFWIGAYWKWSVERLDVWICLLPCLPLHIVWQLV